MNRLHYETTLDGRPKNIRVECDFKYKRGVLNIAGARKQSDGSITLPPDPFNVEQLLEYIPDLQLTDDAKEWFEKFKRKEELLASIKASDKFELMFTDNLYNYQTVDVKFMKEAQRVINANDMGLGKTVEAIATIKELRCAKILCVVPKQVMYNWAKEIRKWDVDDINIVDGTAEERQEKLKRDAKYTLVNYYMIRQKDGRSKFPSLFKTEWDAIIFDEAHRLKNRKAQQSKGAKRLKAKYKIMLTGSPMPNHPHELWHLLHILYPERFSSYWQFVERFCTTEESYFSRTPIITGVKNKEKLQRILVPIMIRREKDEVLDLPPKTYQTIELHLEGQQKKLYQQMERDLVAWINGEPHKVATDLGKMLRLRQLCLTPALIGGPAESVKTNALINLLEDTSHKVVVFSWFKEYIKHLEEVLTDKGFKVVSVHGDKSAKQRHQAEEQFWNDSDTSVFLGTIRAAGEGMNLQCAPTLIFTDKDWVPKVNRQVEARVYRHGQKRNTNIISLICANTIEEDMELAIMRKEDIIDSVLAMENVAKKLLERYQKNG